MKHLYFQILLFGFLVGVFVNNSLQRADLSGILLVLFFCVLIGVFQYLKQYRYIILPVIVWALIGGACSQFTLNPISQNLKDISSLQFAPADMTVTVVDIRKKNTDTVEYKARVEHIWDSLQNLAQRNIFTLVSIPSNFELEPWDTISYRSKISLIEDFNRFEYQNYMLSKDIYFQSYARTFERVSWENISPVILSFFRLRRDLLETLGELYPWEEKIFLAGILLGAREDIPGELKTDFNNSGLTHFIAVSGFNITILVLFFGYIFRYFPVSIRTVFVSISIILFTILVWVSAPVLRAAIMWIIWYLVLVSGRQAKSMALILLTASIMVFLSPLSLNYDVSFHLSFLAVIGIVYTQWWFKHICKRLPETLAIREAFVLTLSALSLTIPIMMFQFGQISLLAPFANIAVTWTIPIAMLLGFLSLIWYMIYMQLGYALAFVDWIFLKYDIMMVHFFWGLDFALLKINFWVYAVYLEALYFMILIFLMVYFSQRKNQIA